MKHVDGAAAIGQGTSAWFRALLIVLGTISLVLGIVGIFIPILPTTPFLLAAAALYARSSKRFYDWLMENRLFGSYIRNYREGNGLPLKVKLLSISLLWATIIVSVMFFVHQTWMAALLLLVALVVSAHILLLKTYRDTD
jgi:uncharacterized membrane protein YbaN (DUF454 family)